MSSRDARAAFLLATEAMFAVSRLRFEILSTANARRTMTDRLPAPRRLIFVTAWAFTILFAAVAIVVAHATGLSFTGATTPLLTIACIGLVAFLYGASGRSMILSDMAHWTVLWVLFSLAAGIATYSAAACGGPTHDAEFVALDARLGFSWPAWYAVVVHHPALRFGLAIAYTSLMPQIIFSILYLGLRGRNDRNAEFFFTASLAFTITLPISWCLPALGALPYFGHADEAARFYFSDLMALRQHTRHVFALGDLKGLITLPSFHTVLALLFVYIHRGRSRVSAAITLLNLALLVSIPVGGGHYLCDMISGAAVGGFSILVVRWLSGLTFGNTKAARKLALATADDLGSS
jgi:PAP2 superfamily